MTDNTASPTHKGTAMQTDRELLELAAKAAGIEVIRSRLHDPLQGDMLVKQSARNSHHEFGPWNPLADDGDALRLAVRLRLGLSWWKAGVSAESQDHASTAIQPFNDDSCAATRRVIVRAAAAIAKAAGGAQ